MYGKTNINICVHILAIDIKFSEFKIVDQIVKYLEEESEAQRIKRFTDQKDGNKQSSSRRTGSKSTRNRKRKIQEIVDTTYSPADTDNFIKESGPSLPPLANIMHRTRIDRLPRPPIRPQLSHITIMQPAKQSLRQPLGQSIRRVIPEPIGQIIPQVIQRPIGQIIQERIQRPIGQIIQERIQRPIGQIIQERIQRPIGQIIPQVIQRPIGQIIQERIPRHLVSNQRRIDDNPHTTETEEVREALK
uniref:Uncharacterized protein n=1 Tax=Panagrolaimus davidi TaxID=227884 RepID=A0A914PCN3_9BILA